MKVAFLTAINDDDDIVYYQLVYYYNIGIRDFYILLHCATKEVEDEIQKFKKKYSDINIKLLVDNDPVYRKDIHYNMLSECAYKDKCAWHVASDADELLILKKHTDIHDFVKDYPDNDVLIFNWYNYIKQHSSADRYYYANNIYLHLTMRNIIENEHHKSIAQWNDILSWVAGQHWLLNDKNKIYIKPETAYYAHFPYRNYKRWEKRQIDFAKTKYNRFKETDSFDSWLKQCNYHKIMHDPNFLFNKWSEIQQNLKIMLPDAIYDPLSEDLFR